VKHHYQNQYDDKERFSHLSIIYFFPGMNRAIHRAMTSHSPMKRTAPLRNRHYYRRLLLGISISKAGVQHSDATASALKTF